eukprot:CAMPEP_0119306616 /NCGR_PEP_ID=MMETSP1333-20130426/7325_1 /TAXON_ID=418940 /ORGANISM="Scyphosphaera apsteinii, Strain RCC1455" /LENGTH=122 /DNA_ID=CAMNT_0007309957 /DNA_START=237 /DNA_END=602 /DNA_ORIENTATION=+
MQTSDVGSTLGSTVRMLLRQPPTMWFRGTVPTLLRDVPFSAIYWCGYEYAKSRVCISDQVLVSDNLRTLLQSFICGAGAGIVAAVLTTPVDMIKTVRQHDLIAGTQSSYHDILRKIRDKPAA